MLVIWRSKKMLLNYEENSEQMQEIKDDIEEVENFINIFDMLVFKQIEA